MQGSRVSRVRLVAADEEAIEDRAEEGYALLMGDLPFGEQYSIEVLDDAGQLLAKQCWGRTPR